jgi:transposase
LEYDVAGTGAAEIAAKKKSLHDSQRDTPRVQQAREAFAEVIDETLSPALDRLKFLDESGANLGMTRLYGRAAPGERVVEGTPDYSGPHYTVVAALDLNGISAPWVFEGAMDAVAFRSYVEYQLGPSLAPGDLVILDNLSAHKDAEARALIEARGAHLLFLPPYSSDFNPIELCWAIVKKELRAAKARSLDALVEALRKALRSITPEHADSWFAHCGYYPA